MPEPIPPDRISVVTGLWQPDLEAHLIADVRARRAADPLQTIVILVGSRLLAEYLLWRFTEVLSGIFNIHFITFADLADRLSLPERLRDPRPSIPLGGKRAALGEALARIPSASYYSAIADRPGFLGALAASFEDLDDAGISELSSLPRGWADSQAKYEALSGINRDCLANLKRFRRHAEDSAITCDTGKAFRSAFGAETLIIYGLYDFTALQWQQLTALAPEIPLHFYLPCVDPGSEFGSAFAFVEPVLERLRRLGAVGSAVALRDTATIGFGSRLFNYSPVTAAPTPPRQPAVEINEANDFDDEIAELTGRVSELVLWERVPASEIGIILYQAERYRKPITKALERAGIPCSDGIGEPLTDSNEAQSLFRLLSLLAHDLSRRDLFDAIASCRLILSSDDKSRPDPVAWEALSTKMGIVSGAAREWFAAITDLERRAEGDMLDGPIASELATAQLPLLRKFLQSIFSLLQGFRERGTWGEYSRAASQLLATVVPDSEIRVRIAGIIAGLEQLDSVAKGTTRDEFIRTLRENLSAVRLGRGGYRTGGVTVCDRMSARGLSFRALFIPGMNEGAVPPAPREDPIINDSERRRINRSLSGEESYPLPLKGRRADEERLLFALAADAAQESLVLTWPSTDERGSSLSPSHLILELCRVLQGASVPVDQLSELPYYRRANSELDGEGIARRSVNTEEFVRRLIAIRVPQDLQRAVRTKLAAEDPRLRRCLEASESRSGGGLFTRWDGIVAARGATAPQIVSATGLESYAVCPFIYLAGRIWDAEPWQEPERLLELPKADIGSIVHKVLQRLFTKAAKDDGLSMHKLPSLRQWMREILQEEIDWRRRHVALPDVIWRVGTEALAERLSQFLANCVSLDDDFHFAQAEQEINPVLSFESAGGEVRVQLEGRIDRRDVSRDGRSIRIVDYKTGQVHAKDNQLAGGTTLQLPLYLKAALEGSQWDRDASRAEYWQITPDGNLKIVAFTGVALGERAEDLSRIVSSFSEAISAGLFPPLPIEGRKTCEGCDYQRICDLRSRAASEGRAGSDTRVHPVLEAREVE